MVMNQRDCPPQAVEQYLKIATRFLLPGPARRIRAELLGHLHQDMLDGLCCGCTTDEAWRQALDNAGPAWKTALGLGRVYSLGLVLRVLLLGGALGGAAFAVQSGQLNLQHVQVSRP